MGDEKNKVDALKAIVDGLEQEKVALETRIREAYDEYYSAKREYERNEKPTPAMLRALKELAADGARLIDRDLFRGGHHAYLVQQSDGGQFGVVSSVYWGLHRREVVSGQKRDGVSDRVSTITEWGRKVLARAETKRK